MTTRPDAPDLILHGGLFTTLDRSNPTANAVAIKNGVFTAVGRSEDVMPLADPLTRIIDLKGRRRLPGLIDNHIHPRRLDLQYGAALGRCTHSRRGNGAFETPGNGYASTAMGTRHRRLIAATD